MNRLQAELQRLYLTPAPQGHVRSAVLELARPADWHAIAQLWHGVQADLELPAPAIAVSGAQGFQLWFSFAEPLAAHQAAAFVEALRLRYLADVARDRVGTASVLPPLEVREGQWSAFVAPDLAPVFAEEPWLDTPPGDEGQADLLCRLASIKSAELKAAMQRLGVGLEPQVLATPAALASADEPRHFLLRVMNDESVDLALRIEAAKALLSAEPRRP